MSDDMSHDVKRGRTQTTDSSRHPQADVIRPSRDPVKADVTAHSYRPHDKMPLALRRTADQITYLLGSV
jgi:hypothetical protein